MKQDKFKQTEIGMIPEDGVKNLNVEQLIEVLKSKDKKTKYRALEAIMDLSRSNKTSQKQEFLNLILSKSSAKDWEERYVAMYALSRCYRKNWNFWDFKKHFLNVLNLIEDNNGRVRIAARNALEHFRSNFLYFRWGEWNTKEKELVKLWTNSLFVLWEKIDLLEEGKMQLHLIQCIKILYQHDMDSYLSKNDFRKYQEIWNKINELDEWYCE